MKVSKSSNRFPLVVATVLATILLGACSGSQQDDEALDAQNDQQANLGEDDAAEGNNAGNLNNNGGNQQYQQGADVNNATEDEETASEESNPTLDNSGGDNTEAYPMQEAAPYQQAVAPYQQAAVPMNQAPMNAAPMNATQTAMPEAAPAPAAAAATAESPIAGGRVRYVREGGVQVMNAPNGSAVLTLDQGEHPLTWEENGWLRITNGMYVPADALSDKGVPRAKSGTGGWAH